VRVVRRRVVSEWCMKGVYQEFSVKFLIGVHNHHIHSGTTRKRRVSKKRCSLIERGKKKDESAGWERMTSCALDDWSASEWCMKSVYQEFSVEVLDRCS